MKLSELIPCLGKTASISGNSDPHIGSLHYRAQTLTPGGLFVAVPGQRADGHDFIDCAIAQGASAIVSQKPVSCPVPVVRVTDSRLALSRLADRFYDHPSLKLVIVGITGTNGKTTTAYLVEQILSTAGFRVGVIGTVNYRFAGQVFPNPVTTPESADLQQILHRMRQAGVSHVVMEVSSHAVDLGRIGSCRFDVGVFTNLTQDHLDYHKDMSHYWACKQRFFTDFLFTGPKAARTRAIINGANTHGKALLRHLEQLGRASQTISVGASKNETIYPQNLRIQLDGIRCTLKTPTRAVTVASPLTGAYNVENVLCAAGVGVALNISPETIGAGIAALAAVPGRLERVHDRAGRFVYVDYAHSPDALENVLTALTTMIRRRLICLFGCGGDRDPAKRPEMGRIAATLSDVVVLTSDNPRSESPQAIIEMILPGIQAAGKPALPMPPDAQSGGYIVEPDRRQAIALAICLAAPGDVVLIAGKGHETYQILSDRTIAFDDRIEASRALDKVNGDAHE
jgi:UDP-N-acetylmuramoyl-L-alanyl-D-glutamate--2,6-diaminopimelate ligase